jgi:glycosyltransferase involved in cell wall biosynthesis
MRKRILYVQFTSPGGYPPLEHSSRLLAQRGWQVQFLGIHMLGSRRLSFTPMRGVRLRMLPHLPGGWRVKLGFIMFLLWTFGWALWWRPRWIYVSDPLAGPAGWLLSWLPGTRIIYHEHDSPTPGLPQSVFMRAVLWFRKRLARRADLCVLPNAERLRLFNEAVSRSSGTLLVWNCPWSADALAPYAEPADGRFRLVYSGSINPERLPLQVVDAMALLPSQVELRMVGYETIGHLGYIRQLRERAERLGLQGRVIFTGTTVTRAEALQVIRSAQLGLAFMPLRTADVNMDHMVGASNKPFDYLASGVPMLVSPRVEWNEAFVEAGLARSCDPQSAESIADAVRWFVDHPEARREMGEQGRQKILREWNYERQFEPVARRIEADPG